MTGRPGPLLTVLVLAMAVEDGQLPPPVVGCSAGFRLAFREASPDVPHAANGTVLATAEPPATEPEPRVRTTQDGVAHPLPPIWPTVLRGDRWQATWAAPRRVPRGPIELHGRLVADWRIDRPPRTHGWVLRVRVVSETIDTSSPDQQDWRRIPALQQLREVQQCPRWFATGMVAPPGFLPPGWYAPVPGDPYVRETGALVDLELDPGSTMGR